MLARMAEPLSTAAIQVFCSDCLGELLKLTTTLVEHVLPAATSQSTFGNRGRF